jgi:hypothetical protein
LFRGQLESQLTQRTVGTLISSLKVTGQRQVLFLDQNKWIDLARSVLNPSGNAGHRRALEKIVSRVDAGTLVVPLTAANIYETQKVNRLNQRASLAFVQATVSNGHVFHCGGYRRKVELLKFLELIGKIRSKKIDDNCFLSNFFLDAFAERPKLIEEGQQVETALKLNSIDPIFTLRSFMVDLPDTTRKQAVEMYSASSLLLASDMATRRQKMNEQKESMHRRVYQATLLIDHLEDLLAIAREVGLPWQTFMDMGDSTAKSIISELPYFDVETEIVVKIERSLRKVSENHFRDMANIASCIPYANLVVLEKDFANLAIQARFDKKYSTVILTDISDLATYL